MASVEIVFGLAHRGPPSTWPGPPHSRGMEREVGGEREGRREREGAPDRRKLYSFCDLASEVTQNHSHGILLIGID